VKRLAQVVVVVGLVVLSWGGGVDARAGTYVVHACALPNGKAARADGWAPVGGGGKAWLRNTCHENAAAPPGALAGGGRPDLSSRKAGWAFTAPSDTTVVSFVLDRAARPDLDTSPFTTWYIAQGAMNSFPPYRLEDCSMGSGGCSAGKGSFVDRAHPANRVAFSGLHAPQIFGFLESSDTDLNRTTSVAQFAIYRATVELLDELPPVIDVTTGSLIRPGTPIAGGAAATVVARDAGGGVATIGLLVDDKVVVERRVSTTSAKCTAPYTQVVPCPRAVTSELAVDTTLIPDGPHQARIFGTDAAGNRAAGEPFDLTTRNQSRPNGANASRSATLRVWFGSRRTRRSATLNYRGTRAITGELKSGDGAPIAGAVVDVHSTHLRTGATEHSVGQATTDAIGRFTYRPKGGPSRSLSFGYRAFSLDDAYTVADRVQLHVRPRITLRATPSSVRNGSRVTFRGRLVGGPGRQNVSVVIYALNGRGTRSRIPVEAARTDRGGDFRLHYRFRTITRRTTFRFLARIQRQSGYPYTSGVSRPIAITVRP
jgi:hypothetical protein